MLLFGEAVPAVVVDSARKNKFVEYFNVLQPNTYLIDCHKYYLEVWC